MDRTEIEIEYVRLRKVKIPFREPFRISNGVVTEKESVIVELHTSGARTSDPSTASGAPGWVGFGEASAMSGSFYSSETPESTWAALVRDLVPDILSRTLQSPVGYAALLQDYKGEPFARAGIEGAVWALYSDRLHTTIRSLIGAPHGGPASAPASSPIASGVALGIFDTVPELLERVEYYLAKGYRRTKIKIQPGWDVEPLSAIREKFGSVPLMVDANASYDLARDGAHLESLDAMDLMMIEQPLAAEALEESAELCRRLRTPICLDESAESLDALQRIIQLQACAIVNIKVQRVGGLWNARRMHDAAHAAGIACWLGTMPELGIASAQSLAIATLPGMKYPTDVEASDRWFIDDIVQPHITVSDTGEIVLPENVPMGYSVDHEALDRYTMESREFTRR